MFARIANAHLFHGVVESLTRRAAKAKFAYVPSGAYWAKPQVREFER